MQSLHLIMIIMTSDAGDIFDVWRWRWHDEGTTSWHLILKILSHSYPRESKDNVSHDSSHDTLRVSCDWPAGLYFNPTIDAFHPRLLFIPRRGWLFVCLCLTSCSFSWSHDLLYNIWRCFGCILCLRLFFLYCCFIFFLKTFFFSLETRLLKRYRPPGFLMDSNGIQSGLYRRFEDVFVRSFSSWIQAPKDYERVLFGGILGSWFSLLQFFITPFIGAASDVFGRRIMLLSCLTGVSLSYFVWTQSRGSFLLFCLSRTLGGMSKGNVSLSTAIVSDVSTHKDRGKGMAMIGIAFSVGFMVGPMMGAALSSSQDSSLKGTTFFLLPAVLALILSLINLIFTSFFFQESLSDKNRVSQQYSRREWLLRLFLSSCFSDPTPTLSFCHITWFPWTV